MQSLLGFARCVPRAACSAASIRTFKRKGYQPRLFDKTLVMTDGSSILCKSPIKDVTERLVEDIHNRQPWAGERKQVLDLTGKLAKFERKFGKMLYNKSPQQ